MEMQNKRKYTLSVLIVLTMCLMPFFAQAQETITVAVASSLYPAMQKRSEAFEKAHHQVTVRLVSGSTGRLYNQIMQGAPFDVFIAADDQRPARLVSQGKAIARYDVGQGYLGVKAGRSTLTDLTPLMRPSIQHIAIANPDVAPFGQTTKAVLQKRGLWRILKHKFVYAQNAMQASMMVNKGLVDAGFVPVTFNDHFIAVIHYQGVLLTHKRLAYQWLQGMITPKNKPPTL